MTKTELKKLKELDAFLREKKMELRGSNIIVGFNADKYDEKDNFVSLNLRLGFLRGSDSDIAELNRIPTTKNRYYIREGKIQQY